MAFRGDLANINLASVLQNLLHNEQTGTLRLSDGDREAFLHFNRGHMTMYSAGRHARTPLAEYLARANLVTPQQVQAAKKRLRGKRNMSAVLGRMGVEPEKIREAARRHLEEGVCDLFTWESGRFEFTEGPPPSGVFDSDMAAASLNMLPDGMILEAARRADTWEQINRHIRSESEILVLRREAAARVDDDFPPEVAEVAKMLDGRRSVRAIAEESGLGRFPVLAAISRLIADGAARPVSLTEVLRLAEVALGNREFAAAASFYRRALEIERNNVECRRGLVEALEGAGDRAEASAERKLLAATFRDTGRFEEAAEELRRAIEDAPTDITAREKHIALLKEMGETRQAQAAGLELGRTYLSLGIAGKACAVFAEVLRSRPHDPARVGMMLADASVKSGDVPAAVDAYRKVAARHIAAEDYNAAGMACEEILKLQPDDTAARKRLAEINTGKLLRRKRRWKVIRVLMMLAALAGLGVAWLVYDWSGRDYLDAMSVEALVRAELGDSESALQCFDAVRQHYPFTRSAASASKLRAALAECLALKLLREGKRLEKLGRGSQARGCYRRAQKLGGSPRTARLLRAAQTRLGRLSPPPSSPAAESSSPAPPPAARTPPGN
jgi:tetratricopeptide (TPR) repeat protein